MQKANADFQNKSKSSFAKERNIETWGQEPLKIDSIF
jgi:hypothetical protein